MRLPFYGALLLAVSLLLFSYSRGTPGFSQQARGASSKSTSVEVIVTSVSADEFDHALAKIGGVELVSGTGNDQSTSVQGVKRTHRPAL